jgi:hypothetical protein
VQRCVQKARGSRSTSHSILIFFTRTTPCTKNKGLPIDISFYSCTFYMCNIVGSRSIIIILYIHNNHQCMKSKGRLYIHHTTHLRYSIKSFQYQFNINIILLQNTKENLHRDRCLSARTTIIILITDSREVILGHEVLSGVIHTIY